MLLIGMILGCLGGGCYAIIQRSLPLSPRRKVIDRPAVWLGLVLIALPFANAALFFAALSCATTWPSPSLPAEKWAFVTLSVAFPGSIAGALILAKRWSVPRHYQGDWGSYTPQRPVERRPDFSFLDDQASGH